MKQIDKIRNMSAEELARFLFEILTDFAECRYCWCSGESDVHCAYEDEDNCIGKSCNEGIKAWLESEVENNG